ncbi:MAG: phosphoglycerate mutase family protein [Acidimicrobiia bacterium]
MVRHAKAGDRHGFDGPDHLRPLSKNGRRQADALASVLATAGVTKLVSSPYVRCMQTLRPAAKLLGTEVAPNDALAEGAGKRQALRLIAAHLDAPVALCSHGDVLGDILQHYLDQGVDLQGDRVEKASIWVLHVNDGDVRAATYLPPPAV